MPEVEIRIYDNGTETQDWRADVEESEKMEVAAIPSPGDTVAYGGSRYVRKVHYGTEGPPMVTLVNSQRDVIGVPDSEDEADYTCDNCRASFDTEEGKEASIPGPEYYETTFSYYIGTLMSGLLGRTYYRVECPEYGEYITDE